MTWQEEFIKACLKKVPAGEYRRRSEAELREHLENLMEERKAAGLGEEELRREVLARMGNPGQLQRPTRRKDCAGRHWNPSIWQSAGL